MVVEDIGEFPDSSNSNFFGEGKNPFTSLNDGSRKSAFLPYKPAVTVLTNLQRGNTKAQTSDLDQEELSIFQLAARGDLRDCDIEKVRHIDAFDQEDGGLTTLMWACAYGQNHTVNALLSAGADVDAHNSKGQTALHFAATSGCPEVMMNLLSYGADINYPDERGNSALHFSTNHNHPHLVNILLTCGADFTKRNGEGESAHHVAVRKNYTEIQHLIENHIKQWLTGEITAQ